MINGKSYITINTDASFNLQYKIGGYAFYIVSDIFKIKKGGMFKKEPLNSQEAEEMCIANAISTLFIQRELPKCDYLIINGDCKFAFNTIKQSPGRENKPRDICKIKLNQLLKRLGNPKYEFRHVKAHSGKDDARSKVNEWCDSEAKKWMRLSVENYIKTISK